MNKETLLKLVQALLSLKSHLKCPICLDTMQDVAELSCGHRFCGKCFSRHKSVQSIFGCPTCRTLMTSRSFVYKDSYASAVGKFVSDWCQTINTIYHCEIERLPQILEARQFCQKDDICNKVLPSTSKLMSTNIQTAKSEIEGRLTPERRNVAVQLKNNFEDAFDELLDPLQRELRRATAKNVYTNKRVANKKLETRYNNLDFEFDENRLIVLRWLNDTRNDFERTVTQFDSSNRDAKLPSSVPVDSISQSKLIAVKPKEVIKRARSLDIKIHRPVLEGKKCYSHCGVFEPEQDYNIDIEGCDLKGIMLQTKKKVLMTMLEEDVLKRYDREFRENTNFKCNEPKKTDEKLPSPHLASGWERLSEINKSLRKKEKAPKKLNVMLQTKAGAVKKSTNKPCPEIVIMDKEKPINEAPLITCKEFEEFVTNAINEENNKVAHQKDDLNTLYNMPTQKVNGCDNHDKSTEKGNNVIVIESDDDDLQEIFSNPTQKFVFNELCTDKKEDFGDLLQLFERGLVKCFADLDTQNITSMKTNLNDLQTVLEKFKCLKNLSYSEGQKVSQKIQTDQISTNDIGVQILIQTERKDADCQTERRVESVHSQTINPVRTVQVQTYHHVDSVQVQTEQLASSVQVQTDKLANENGLTLTRPESGNIIESLSQNTKDAMKLLLIDTESLKQITQNILTSSFETQELLRKSEQESTSKCPDKTTGLSQTSVLVCTVDPTNSNKAKRKSSFDPDKSRKFKRVRRLISDSDSEVEGEGNNKNPFIRDDLTVHFETCTNKNDDDLQNSANVDYEKFLSEVLKKYDNEDTSAVSERDVANSTQSQLRTNDSQVKDLQILLHRVNPKDVLSSHSSKESFHTPPQENVNLDEPDLFMDEQNLEKLEKDILEHEKLRQHSTEISDIIGETETLEPVPKKLKIYKKDVGKKENVLNTEPKASSSRLDDFDVGKEDMDSNDRLTEFLELAKVHIISNVLVKNPKNKGEPQNAEKYLSSEDDEDIIEMTPQEKNATFSERPLFSQNIGKSAKLPSPPLSDSDSLDFEIANIPPPPDFRDETCNKVVDLITPTMEIDSDGSNTPENVLMPSEIKKEEEDESLGALTNTSDKENRNKNVQSLTPDSLSQFVVNPVNKLYSTPRLTQRNTERLSLSRLSQHSSIFESVQSSSYNPLNIVRKEPTRKWNKLTSIPHQTSILNYINASPGKSTKPCVSWTRLDKDQISSVLQLEDKNLIRCKSQLDKDVTHLVINVNGENLVKYQTFKYVTAVAAGLWIVSFKWVEECLARNEIVPEERFEVLDTTGLPGPMNSRTFRLVSPLLKGFTFYCKPPFATGTREQFEEIIRLAGGKVVPNPGDLLKKDGNVKLIIAETATTQDFDLLHGRWVNLYKAVPVEVMWLVSSVGQYQLKSLRSHLYCSESYLTQLNYPSLLTRTDTLADDTS